MNEHRVDLDTADGTMETFAGWPSGAGPFPVVVLYMDAPGIREELYEFARRIAGQGYYCLLPDLYYRRGRIRLDLSGGDVAAVRAEMFGHMRSLDNAQVLRDTRALLDFCRTEAAASDGPKGCIGYCMSGQYVVSAAGTFPDEFAAIVSCYGVAIVTDADDSPHRLASKIRGELLLAFAEHDDYVPDAVIEKLDATLDEHGVAHTTIVYPGTGHGFCFPHRPAAYVEEAAEDVWRRSFELFARRLR